MSDYQKCIDLINEAHELLAKTDLGFYEYTEISTQLINVKFDLAKLITNNE